MLPAISRVVTGALLMLVTWSPPAEAAQYTTGLRVWQQLGYSDNIELQARDARSSPVSTTTAEASLGVRSPRTELDLDLAWDYARYFEADEFDSSNQLLQARVLRLGRRSTLGLDGSVRRDTTLVDPARSRREARRQNERQLTFDLSPSFTHFLSRRSQLQLAGNWRHRLYPSGDGPESGTVDYTLWSGSVGLDRILHRRLTMGAYIYASYFDSARQRSTWVGPRLRLEHKLTERRSVTIEGGPSWSSATTQRRHGRGRLDDEDSSETGFQLEAQVEQVLTPTTRVELSAFHGLEPSDEDGEVVTTSRLTARLRQELTRRLRLELTGLIQRQSETLDSGTQDSDYGEIEPGLFWTLGERTELSLRYRYRHEVTEDEDAASSHAVLVRIDYRFPEMRHSR